MVLRHAMVIPVIIANRAAVHTNLQRPHVAFFRSVAAAPTAARVLKDQLVGIRMKVVE